MAARCTPSELYELLDALYRERRAELHDAARRQRFTLPERNGMARRVDRLRAARELAYRLASDHGEQAELLLPPEGDVEGALRLVKRCISGPDELSTAFRELVVKVDGSVTLGQVVDAALAGQAELRGAA